MNWSDWRQLKKIERKRLWERKNRKKVQKMSKEEHFNWTFQDYKEILKQEEIE